MALHGTVKPGWLLCFPLCQCLAVELPKISEPTHHWPVPSYSRAARDRRVCVLQPRLRYESGEQGEAQGAGHERDTVTAEESPLWKRAGHHAVSQSCTLCQAEPSSICWGTSSYSQHCGLPSSCPRTDLAWTISTWHGLGLTAVLELPQEHAAFKSHNLCIPPPCPTRLPWVWERERSHSSSSLHPPPPHLSVCWGQLGKRAVHPGCLTTDHGLDNPTEVKPGEQTFWISDGSSCKLAPEGRRQHNIYFFLCGRKTSKRPLLQHK